MSDNPRLSFIGRNNAPKNSLIPSNNLNPSDRRKESIKMESQKYGNNLELMDQQLKYINQYNQNAVNHNQMILEMQETKLNNLMQDYNRLQDEMRQYKKEVELQKNDQQKAYFLELEKKRTRNIQSREKDMQNLMILDKFQWTLGNGNNLSFDNVLNMNSSSIFDNPRSNDHLQNLERKMSNLKNEIKNHRYEDNHSSSSNYRGFNNPRNMNNLPNTFNSPPQNFNNNYQNMSPNYGNNGLHQNPNYNYQKSNLYNNNNYNNNNNHRPSFNNNYQTNPFKNNAANILNPSELEEQDYEIDYSKNKRLLETIERQNQLLENLAGSLKNEKEDKFADERKYLEKRIKKMEKLASSSNPFNPYNIYNMDKNFKMPDSLSYNGFNNYPGSFFPTGMNSPFMNPYGMPSMMNPYGPFGMHPGPRRNPILLKKLGLLADDDQNGRSGRKRRGRRETTSDDESESEEESEDEETKKKREEEEKKRLELEKKTKRDRNWRIFRYVFSFPIIFFNEVKAKILAKRAAAQAATTDEIQNFTTHSTKWLLEICSKSLDQTLKDPKLNLNVIPLAVRKIWGAPKTLQGKDLDLRVENLYTRCKMFLDNLISGTKEESLTKPFLQFLGRWTHDRQVPPQNFFFDFEINRLAFDAFAQLKDMNPPKGQMVCSMFIILRVLLYIVILRPFSLKLCEPTDQIKVNTRMIASVLYITLMDYLKGVIPINHNNQVHLAPENKVKSRAGGPMKAEDTSIAPPGSKKKIDDECFVGLFNQTELEAYFKHKKNGFDNLKNLIEAWCTDIWALVEKNWNESEEKRKEEINANRIKDKSKGVDAVRRYERWIKEQEQFKIKQL